MPDSVAVSSRFLAATGLALGDRIRVRAPHGEASLTIRARLDLSTGLAALFGGRLAIMDVFAAQRLFGLDGRFSQLDVGVAPDVDVGAVEGTLVAAVAGRGVVERPEARAASLDRLMSGQRYAMVATTISALLVGAILTFGTMIIAVAQRRRHLGLLRLAGMRRRELFRLVLLEAVALGTLGALVGAPLGWALARLGADGFAALMRRRFALPLDAAAVDVSTLGPLLGCMALGPAFALLGVLLPARETLRLQPVEVLRPSIPAAGPSSASHALALVGGILIGVAGLGWTLRDRLDPVLVGNLVSHGLLVGLALVSPAAVRTLAARGAPGLGRLFGPIGWLAARNLVGNLRRLEVTSIMLMVSLGGALVTANVFASVHHTMASWLRSNFSRVDLLLASNGRPMSSAAMPFPAAALRDVAAVPEVAGVEGWRVATIPYGGTNVWLTAVDTAFYRTGIRRFDFLEGDPVRAVDALVRGEGVVVNGPFAGAFDARPGATVALATPTGELRLPVVGVTLDQSDLGRIYVGRDVYRERWRDDTVTIASVALRDGVAVERGAAAIRACCGTRHALFVATAADFRRELEAVLTQVFALVYPGIAIAFVIALSGLTNTLLAAVEEQVRSIGAVRAVGGTRRQLTRALMLEAAAAGVFAGLVGIVVAAVAGWVSLQVNAHVFHMTLLYRYPLAEVLFALTAAAVLSAAAGWLPGRQAARIRVATALAWE